MIFKWKILHKSLNHNIYLIILCDYFCRLEIQYRIFLIFRVKNDKEDFKVLFILNISKSFSYIVLIYSTIWNYKQEILLLLLIVQILSYLLYIIAHWIVSRVLRLKVKLKLQAYLFSYLLIKTLFLEHLLHSLSYFRYQKLTNLWLENCLW